MAWSRKAPGYVEIFIIGDEMSLKNIRDKFVEITGRADLVVPGMAVGADFFINEGQKTLDRMLDGNKTGARYFVDLDIAQVLVPLPSCRSVRKVFVADASRRTALDLPDDYPNRLKTSRYNRYYYFYDYYMNFFSGFNIAWGLRKPTAQITPARPRLYSPIWARPFPGTITVTDYSQQWIFDTIIDSGHENFNAIVIYPPPDLNSYTLEMWGNFYSDELVDDEDTSYWTEVHPLLLIKAANLHVEQSYRNTEGVKDMLGSAGMPGTILGDMFQLNADVVEEEIAEIDHMMG